MLEWTEVERRILIYNLSRDFRVGIRIRCCFLMKIIVGYEFMKMLYFFLFHTRTPL